MKQLIVSADDFGLTEGINNGIVSAYREGIVTSASLMPNMPSFDHAVALAKDNPDLAIGVHLNVLKGEPLQPVARVPSLVKGSHQFCTLPLFVARLVSGRIGLGEIETELRSQIEKVIATGLKITHLDSHRHFHIYPSILKVVVRIAGEYRINAVRYPRSISMVPLNFKELLLTTLSRKSLGRIRRTGIRHNCRFFDLVKIESRRDFSRAFARFCAGLPPGVTELDCHPGFVSDDLDGIEATIHDRERQIEILTRQDTRDTLRQYGITLINYGDIAWNGA